VVKSMPGEPQGSLGEPAVLELIDDGRPIGPQNEEERRRLEEDVVAARLHHTLGGPAAARVETERLPSGALLVEVFTDGHVTVIEHDRRWSGHQWAYTVDHPGLDGGHAHTAASLDEVLAHLPGLLDQ
jgi:hypothetical protein